MSKSSFDGNRRTRHSVAMLVCITVAALLLAGCAPAYNTRRGPYAPPPPPSYQGGRQCYQGCGYVRQIREVQLNNNSNGAAIGTVIGAVVGGLIGHQVGGGKGKTAATVAGAVGGGFAGHAIGERRGRNGDYGWQVVVQLNNGQYATVTQRDQPQVQIGDYVAIRDNEVYRY